MSLESIVTSLEPSKRLAEIGVIKPSIFRWFVDETNGYSFIVGPGSAVNSERKYPEKYAAFTAQELWDMIDPEIYLHTQIFKANNICEANSHLTAINSCINCKNPEKHTYFEDKNMANCLARLIIAQHKQAGVNDAKN